MGFRYKKKNGEWVLDNMSNYYDVDDSFTLQTQLLRNAVKNMEEQKMTEGQSRYGIMEELNNRKINEREKLANIERETDNFTYQADREIDQTSKIISQKEASYEREHKDWKREKTLRVSMLTQDFQRQSEAIESEIKERDSNYKPDFTKWKEDTNKILAEKKENLKKYKDTQAKKIKEKEQIIDEIEKGITSLKEMSKEHSTKE